MKKSAITINQKVLDQLAERNVVVNLTKRLPTVTIFVKEALPDLERVPRGLYLTEIYGGDIINGELNNAFRHRNSSTTICGQAWLSLYSI